MMPLRDPPPSEIGDMMRVIATEFREIDGLARLFAADKPGGFDPVAALRSIGECATRAADLAFAAADNLEKEMQG